MQKRSEFVFFELCRSFAILFDSCTDLLLKEKNLIDTNLKGQVNTASSEAQISTAHPTRLYNKETSESMKWKLKNI